MLNFLSNKEKGILGAIALLGIGSVIAKGLYDYSNYKTLQWIKKRLKHNTEYYYE